MLYCCYVDFVNTSNAGIPSKFRIYAQSMLSNNNTIEYGPILEWGTGLSLKVTITNIDQDYSEYGTVKDNGNGIYDVSYTLYGGTQYLLFILLDGNDITGSPFSVTNIPSALSPQHCTLLPPQPLLPSSPSTFVLQLNDEYGSPIVVDKWINSSYSLNITTFVSFASTSSSFSSSSAFSSYSPLYHEISFNPNGTISVLFSSPSFLSGDDSFQIVVLLNNLSVQGSPLTMNVAHFVPISELLITVMIVVAAVVLLIIALLSGALVYYREAK